MPRIGATISGFEQLLLTHLQRVNSATLAGAVRLSTGKQVNRPADDPSAFMTISSFERRLSVVQDAKRQVDVAANIGAQSQLTLDQIRTELEGIRASLVLDEDGSLTDEERTAEQAIIDRAVVSINDLAATDIGGRRFLDGSVNYRAAGRLASQISNVEVYAAGETDFTGSVDTAATQAAVTYTGVAGAIVADATFTLTGKRGSSSIQVTLGQTLDAAASLINQDSHKTGIVAAAAGDDLTLTTVDYGEQATLEVDVSTGSFDTAGTNQGTDVVAIINGQTIDSSATDGNRARYTSQGTHVVFEFQPGFTDGFNPVTVLDDDVAQFRLSPDLRVATQLGLPGVSAALLGGVSGAVSELASGGGLAGLAANTSQAIRVIDEALGSLTRVDGIVDSFADVTVASSASLLDGFSDELETTIENLNGVDEERENLLLAKNQSLADNTVSSISILQQQQASLVELVRQLADR